MTAYTKEEFEQYKGDVDFLEVQYYSQYDTIKHETYEDYIEFFNWFCMMEQLNEHL